MAAEEDSVEFQAHRPLVFVEISVRHQRDSLSGQPIVMEGLGEDEAKLRVPLIIDRVLLSNY